MAERFNFGRDFVKYDPDFMDHLDRHIRGSGTVGSTFVGELDARAIVDYAYEKIRELYRGERVVLEVDVPFVVGLEGVIMLSRLPRGTEITKVKRDKIHEVNVVKGLKKRKTRHLVIVAGPLEPVEKGRHGFISIYPGMCCPDLSNREFWGNYAFIDSEIESET